MKIDDLPPNVLLMRILDGLKSLNPDAKSACPPSSKPVESPQSLPVVSNHRNSDVVTGAPQPPAQQIQTRPVLNATPLKQKYLPHPQNVCHAKALFDFQSDITG